MRGDNLVDYEEPIHHESYDLGYEQGILDTKEEMLPLLRAIKFVLDDYTTLEDYSKVIDEQLKEKEK